MRAALALALASALVGGSAVAQDAAPDLAWTVTKKDGLQAVSIDYDVGITLSAICQNNRFLLAIGGLQPAEGADTTRTLEVSLRDDTLQPSRWTIPPNGDRTVALSPAPSIYARSLTASDTFTIRVPAQGEAPARRYRLALPSDHAALDAVMTDCRVSLENAADATYAPNASDFTWVVPPQVTPPSPLPSSNYVEALIQCSVDESGRPRNCVLLDELPSRSGFGRQALQMVRTGRVGHTDGAPITAGGVFTMRMVFNMTER